MASINYNDSRFTELEEDKKTAIDNSNATYDGLINESGKYYDDLINQSKEWADKQAEIQNQQTQFVVDKIEQQKQEAEKDYTKEQKGAYQDYMKQSNAYGSSNQTMGQQGLSGSGWSETIQSGYYNTYQNRYAQARESYNEIVMNYNNNIKEAELQNNSALAEIYANASKEQLELALQQYSVIADLKLNKLNTSIQLDSEYNDRWRQIEAQINTENALAEQIRQYNESLAEEKRQFNASLNEQKRQYNSNMSAYNYTNSNTTQIKTKYYSGDINPDTQYGTFKTEDSNGVRYQPDNIGGTKLKSSGKTVGQLTGNKNITNSSGVNIANQTAWKIGDQYYVWNGSKNTYEKLTAK